MPLYTVDAITQAAAKEANIFNQQQSSGENPAVIQITQIDGSMVPIVDFARAEDVLDPDKKADKRKRRQCQWKEIRVCSTRDPSKADARYGVSFGGVLEAGLMMRMNCEQEGMDENTYIHGVGDGASWIADQFEKQFGTQGSFLLDFYHTGDYLGAASESCVHSKTPAEKKKWMDRQKKRLKENQHGQVLKTLEKFKESDGVADANAPVRQCWRYLKNRQDQLDYQGAIAQDLPIGSGEIESAHRHLIQQRLKLSGAWWLKETASNMAQLRVTRANQLWDAFWNQKAA
ncbi:MAG: UPF0236 family protein [Verrucomicrobiales bacterium]|nr:UPF0236 family protein [Verrucomicrobiales bacterium]